MVCLVRAIKPDHAGTSRMKNWFYTPRYSLPVEPPAAQHPRTFQARSAANQAFAAAARDGVGDAAELDAIWQRAFDAVIGEG
jgi:hypothetical protein